MSFILADGCVVTMNGVRDILDRDSILVEGDRIAGIGTAARLSARSDIELLRRHDVKVSHDPCGNMCPASGLAPTPEMLKAGVTVGLASDGPDSSSNHSQFQAMKFAALIQKGFRGDATIMTEGQVLEW